MSTFCVLLIRSGQIQTHVCLVPSQTGDSVLTEKNYSSSRQSEGCVFGSVCRISRKRNGVMYLGILSFLAAGLSRLDGQGDLWLRATGFLPPGQQQVQQKGT